MATIKANRNKNGDVVSYRFRACIGQDEHNKRVWRSCTIERPDDLTPARERKEVERQADAWEQEQRKEFEDIKARTTKEQRTDKAKLTIPEFIDKYWTPLHVENGKHTPATVTFYKQNSEILKTYFLHEQPKLKLIELSKNDVLDMLKYFRKEKKRNGEPFSPTSIQHFYNMLKRITDFAVYMDFRSDNPCKKIRPEDRPRKENHEIDFLEQNDAIKFIACLDDEKEVDFWKKAYKRSPLMWKCLVNVMILTGCRRGEICGLKWTDLDDDRTLHIRRNVTIDTTNKKSKEPLDHLHIGETKNKKIRKVAVSQYLYDLLQLYKEEQKKRFKVVFLGDAYIFCRNNDLNLPMYPTELTRMTRKYVERHDLPNVSPHDLRHTAASLAIEAGSNVKDIQNLLGHSDPTVTLEFYAAVTEKAAKRTVENIEEMIRPKPKKEEEKKAE